MGDPEIHSSTWEWDSASTAAGWTHSHNYVHHTYTDVLGKVRDLGYAAMRVDPCQPWKPIYLLQPFSYIALALSFEYGIAIYDIGLEKVAAGTKPCVPGAVRARRSDHTAGQPDRGCHTKCMVERGDLLCSLPGGRGNLHRGPTRRRDPRAVVRTSVARLSQHRRVSPAAPGDRQPEPREQLTRRAIQVDGATTLLQAGEQAGGPMPFGCRMGICHTCVIPLTSGRVPDLRNGSEYGDYHRTMRFATS